MHVAAALATCAQTQDIQPDPESAALVCAVLLSRRHCARAQELEGEQQQEDEQEQEQEQVSAATA